MARTPKLQEVPAPPLPAAALSLEPTLEEQQIEFVTRMMMRCLSKQDIGRLCREKFAIGQTRVENLIQRILDQLRAGHERNRPYARAEQIARVRHLIAKLHEPRFKKGKDGKPQVQPMTSAVAGRLAKLEELLADLEGNREPVKVAVGVILTQAAQVVFANMSDEKLGTLVERARERKRLAQGSSPLAEPSP